MQVVDGTDVNLADANLGKQPWDKELEQEDCNEPAGPAGMMSFYLLQVSAIWLLELWGQACGDLGENSCQWQRACDGSSPWWDPAGWQEQEVCKETSGVRKALDRGQTDAGDGIQEREEV